MKAQLKAKITSVVKSGGEVIIHLSTVLPGKVSTHVLNAKDIHFDGNITLKELVANQIKIGAIILVTLMDEEAEDGLE